MSLARELYRVLKGGDVIYFISLLDDELNTTKTIKLNEPLAIPEAERMGDIDFDTRLTYGSRDSFEQEIHFIGLLDADGETLQTVKLRMPFKIPLDNIEKGELKVMYCVTLKAEFDG